MSTTSKKHQDFVSEPMGEKEVTAIAGIGDVLGKRLEEKGFDKVIYCFFIRESIFLTYLNYLGVRFTGSIFDTQKR